MRQNVDVKTCNAAQRSTCQMVEEAKNGAKQKMQRENLHIGLKKQA